MANERLRSCMTEAHLTINDVAKHVGVDPKTVERWISTDRVPHRRHRWSTASLLQVDEAYLWPQTLNENGCEVNQAECITLYPTRSAVPADLWISLFKAAKDCIDILVYSSSFLPDSYPEFTHELSVRADEGVTVRLLFGDPDSKAVSLRGEEENIGEGMAGRIRLSLSYLREARNNPKIEFRLHGTTLYNSIYRFDDDMLVNTHAYGAPAAHSVVLHLRRLNGGSIFRDYEESLERVWSQATSLRHDR
jgi:hypothetical protein